MTPGALPPLIAVVLIGCRGPLSDAAPPVDTSAEAPLAASPMAEAIPDDFARDALLGPFLAEFWRLPVPAQGPTPEGWSDVEASLDPQVCGACHPQQYREWSSSLHAAAYSPGFAGQLVVGSLSRPGPLRHCQTCHAPLAEQQPVLAGGEPEPAYDAALRAQGIVCASCHVRAHGRIGPLRRPELPERAAVLPHAGFVERAEFSEGRFCATCHQFFDRSEPPAGKPVQNTFVEWRESPQAAAGRTCQSCHMPDRAHTWRGIHDADFTRAAVDVAFAADDVSGELLTAALALTNRDVGHAFPSYVTPRVFLAVWQVAAGGAELDGTRREAAIGREVDFAASPARERFDTRVLPGESFTLDYAEPRRAGAVRLRAEVRVDPGHHYRGVYRGLLRSLEDPLAREQIERALRREDDTPYVLAEALLPLPPDGDPADR